MPPRLPWLAAAVAAVALSLAGAPPTAAEAPPLSKAAPAPSLVVAARPARMIRPAPTPAFRGGRFDSTYGIVELTRDGDAVFGRYQCCGAGSVRGRIVGQRIVYTWREDRASEAVTGHGVWTVGADGTLTGTWGWGKSDADGGAWNLWPDRASAGAQIAR